MNIQQIKAYRLWCCKIIFKIIITLCFICITGLSGFANDEPNYDDRIIQIACLPHKTFSNPKNKVKIINAIEMRSTDEDFGGLSAIVMMKPKEKTYLLSDRAHLIIADTILNPKTQAIECFNNALIRPLRGRSTNPLSGHYADAEGMSLDTDGKKILVSFERHHRVVAYDPTKKKLLPQKDYTPFDKHNLPYNESYETVLRLKDKSIIAFPERYEVQDAILRGFRLMPDGKVLQNLHLKRIGGFWLTDIAQLSNGDFVTLERSFNIFNGMGMQIRHIKQSNFLAGKIVDGEVIFTMKSGDGVDNFEGLDVVPQPDGTNMMYVTSDNNFSSLQKTLLLSLSYKP